MSIVKATSQKASKLFDSMIYSVYLVGAWVLFRLLGVDEMLEHQGPRARHARKDPVAIAPEGGLSHELPR